MLSDQVRDALQQNQAIIVINNTPKADHLMEVLFLHSLHFVNVGFTTLHIGYITHHVAQGRRDEYLGASKWKDAAQKPRQIFCWLQDRSVSLLSGAFAMSFFDFAFVSALALKISRILQEISVQLVAIVAHPFLDIVHPEIVHVLHFVFSE